MELPIAATPPPLQEDTHGVVRVGATRVTLQTVVTAFKYGSTCEEIVYQYPSLELADVYAAISYYLEHREDVEAYLEERQKRAEVIRQQIESQFDSPGIRERLLKRRSEKNE